VIAVVGAGITGLAAAFELHQRGVPFVLLEASNRLGGLIRTEHADGFTIEAGPDSILAQKSAALELVDALGLTPRLISTSPPRTAFVLKHGRLHQLPSPSVLGIPLTTIGALTYDLLPIAARVRLLAEPWISRPTTGDAPSDESVASFFRRRFGAATVDLVAEPLLGGIHAGDIDALSIASLFPRFVEAESRGSVLRAMRGASRPDGEGLFRSLQSGMSELVAALERRLPPDAVHRTAWIDGLTPDGSRWRLTAGGRAWTADAVLLAIPAFVASRLLAPIDSDAAALCAEVPYVSTASIALAWPRDAISHPLDGSGFVVARRHDDVRITACTWVSSKWAGRAPEGSALLRVFIGGAHDPGAAALGDDELIAIARRDIAPVLGISGAPQLTRVARWPNAGPQHNVGQLARMTRIDARLAAHPGLFAAGSGFRSVGIPDCIADGRAAAERAAQYATMRR
jgi:oxygen-dependent protoporphyrinogen oxidase